jgi:signal transduction histidine kinase
MKFFGSILYLLALIIIAIPIRGRVVPSKTIRQLNIDYTRDPRFLPYVLDTIEVFNYYLNQPDRYRSRNVIKEKRASNDTAIYMSYYQDGPEFRGVYTLGLRRGSELKGIEDSGIRLIPTDICSYYDSNLKAMAVAGIGYRNDSAFIFKKTIRPDELRMLFIGSGKDHTGDDRWTGVGICQLISDYDYDGRQEVFFSFSAGRDLGPYLLLCVEMEEMKIEWRLELSSQIDFESAFDCRDSTNPGAVFLTTSPAHGISINGFNDFYSYVFRVDGSGKIVFKGIWGQYVYTPRIAWNDQDSTFIVSHQGSYPSLEEAEYSNLDNRDYLISKMNRSGEMVASVNCPGKIDHLWKCDYDSDGNDEIYAINNEGEIFIFSSKLNLIAKSENAPQDIAGLSLPFKFGGQSVCLLKLANGTRLYTSQLQPLAYLGQMGVIYPLEYDNRGNITIFTSADTRNGDLIFRLKKQSIADYFYTIYNEYQTYILTALFSLVIGIALLLHFRRKDRKHLALIAAQKNELEEAHQSLKDAQATIIAQEKYKHAKDIAGMFAHEIRNTLFPAEAVLTKMELSEGKQNGQTQNPQFRQMMQKAVKKAIHMTDLVSQYVRLESQYLPEKANLRDAVVKIIDESSGAIESASVEVELRLPADLHIEFNGQQLDILLNNLLRNSLEALTETAKPFILITGKIDQNGIVMEFADNGCGIRKEDLPKLLNNIYSTKPTTGLGIGLINCRKIVELYGGTISIKSEEKIGTNFLLHFKPFSSS